MRKSEEFTKYDDAHASQTKYEILQQTTKFKSYQVGNSQGVLSEVGLFKSFIGWFSRQEVC